MNISSIFHSELDLWKRQRAYNILIRGHNADKEQWTMTYLLGMISECNSVLDEINWKRNRKSDKKICYDNLAYELADITKYVMSLWELWGFSLSDAFRYVSDKSDAIEQQYSQEFAKAPENEEILICDIDGLLADWRASFTDWIRRETGNEISIEEDPAHTLQYDTDNGLGYSVYSELKDSFEQFGGYRTVLPYQDSVLTVRHLISSGKFVIIYTARPVSRWHRIWLDTWTWLQYQQIVPNILLFGAEKRVSMAIELSKKNKVIMFDDDPELIQRAVNSGIRVFAKAHRYNAHLRHPNLTMLDEFEEDYDYFHTDAPAV